MNDITVIEKPAYISWDDIHVLIDRCHHENRDIGFHTKSAAQTGEQLAREVGENGKCFVALDGRTLVGTMSYRIEKLNRWYYHGPAAYCMLVAIDPEYRKKGIFPLLTEKVNESIADCPLLFARTAEKNVRVQQISTRNGYRYVRFSYPRGTDHYNVELAKWLNSQEPPIWKCNLLFAFSEMKTRLKYRAVKNHINTNGFSLLKSFFKNSQVYPFSKKISSSERNDIHQAVVQILNENFPHVNTSGGYLELDSLGITTLTALLSTAFDVTIDYRNISSLSNANADTITDLIVHLKNPDVNIHTATSCTIKKFADDATTLEPILDIPWSEAEKPVVQRVLECAQREPESAAVVVNGETFSYGVLARQIRRYAEAFRKLGVVPGDRVVIQAICEECYLVSVFALHLCGAVVVPVEKAIGCDCLLEIAAETAARCIVSGTELKSAAGSQYGLWVEYADVEAAAPAVAPSAEVTYPSLDSAALVLFTTGSTGKSKGVVMPHRSNAWLCVASPRMTDTRKHTRTITTFPLNHTAGLYVSMYTLACGGTLIMVDGMKNLDAFFGALLKYRPNKLAIPPMAFQMIIRSGWDTLMQMGHEVLDIGFGSEPMPLNVLRQMQELFPNAKMRNVYGCTELAYVSCAETRVGEEAVPLGIPFEGVEIALKDETGTISTQRGRTGQICVRSKMVMSGYFNLPELTAQTMENGWFLMSDMGYLDENGVLYFRGRADDVITLAGYKISPVEVEEAAGNSQLLAECVCIRGEDKSGTPYLRLLVVPKEADSFTEAALRTYLESHLEAYRVPRTIEVVESVTRNQNGKIDRKAYR